ncbi:MAG: signal transduction histidine kinase [Frankiales bacterium]|nr:signal transduction histidine kinase [Frankiales bacterium]
MADWYDEELFQALDAVVEVLEGGRDRLAVVAARAAELRAGRSRGLSYAELLTGARHPIVLDVLSELLDGLFDAGSRLRRAEARAMYADGLSMEKIASLLGVSRQRVSAIINSPFGRREPEHRDVREPRSALSLTDPEFRLIADSLPLLVGVTDADGTTEYVNQQTVDYTGLRRPTNEEWAWPSVLHPDDREAAQTSWRHAVVTGSPYEIESRIRRADGEYRWHLCRSLPVRGPDGRPLKWIGTGTDIDDFKRVESELARLRAAVAEAAPELAASTPAERALPQRP